VGAPRADHERAIQERVGTARDGQVHGLAVRGEVGNRHEHLGAAGGAPRLRARRRSGQRDIGGRHEDRVDDDAGRHGTGECAVREEVCRSRIRDARPGSVGISTRRQALSAPSMRARSAVGPRPLPQRSCNGNLASRRRAGHSTGVGDGALPPRAARGGTGAHRPRRVEHEQRTSGGAICGAAAGLAIAAAIAAAISIVRAADNHPPDALPQRPAAGLVETRCPTASDGTTCRRERGRTTNTAMAIAAAVPISSQATPAGNANVKGIYVVKSGAGSTPLRRRDGVGASEEKSCTSGRRASGTGGGCVARDRS
jgi:hypothetical protein